MLGRLFNKRDNDTVPISIYDWQRQFRPGASVVYNGTQYQSFTNDVSPGPYYDSNAVVFACEANRMLVFSEARFQFQQLRGGRPGDLFGTPALAILEEPWPGASTRELLMQAELDVFSTGNSYWVFDGQWLTRLDAAKVKVVTEAVRDPLTGRLIGERLLAYAYLHEHGAAPVLFTPQEVAHYKPYPDARNRFIGRSWVSACLPDVDGDEAMNEHKRTTLREGANLGYVVSMDKDITPDDFQFFVDTFRADHERPENSGKTLFLGGGADVKTVGQTFENLALQATQSAGETRIAACSGVPPIIIGFSEGLTRATYSNYELATRRFGDGTLRPLWGAFAAAMASVVAVPSGARLWYDDGDIAFLREDVTNQAVIISQNAATIVALINGGFDPNEVVVAVQAGDLSRLTNAHTGLVSVQLQPPGSGIPPADEAGSGVPPPGPTPAPAPAMSNTPSRARHPSTKGERAQVSRALQAQRDGVPLDLAVIAAARNGAELADDDNTEPDDTEDRST